MLEYYNLHKETMYTMLQCNNQLSISVFQKSMAATILHRIVAVNYE